MSASTSLVALDGVTTAHGVSVASPAAEAGGDPVAGRVLPARAEFAAVLPWPGLRRGSTVAVHESTSLLFALLSAATAAGSWAAVVGLPGLGLAAASEAGVELSRLALVPHPGDDPVAVIAALLDGVDLVVVGRPGLVTEADARRLSTRARHRGAVLLPFGAWPGAEVRLRCGQARWRGVGQGHGHLREREVTVRAGGRGAASRPRSCRMLLPGRGGPSAPLKTTTPLEPAAPLEPTAPLQPVAPLEPVASTEASTSLEPAPAGEPVAGPESAASVGSAAPWGPAAPLGTVSPLEPVASLDLVPSPESGAAPESAAPELATPELATPEPATPERAAAERAAAEPAAADLAGERRALRPVRSGDHAC